MYYASIVCITIDSVLRIKKKNCPQVYLEEGKYKINKTQVFKFIKNELNKIRFRFRFRKNGGKN